MDGGNYSEIEGIHLSEALPRDGHVEVEFKARLPSLTTGSHHVCVRATAYDTHNDAAQAEDCTDFVIKSFPTRSPAAAPTEANPAPTGGPTNEKATKPPKPSLKKESGDGGFPGAALAAMLVVAVVCTGSWSLARRVLTGKEKITQDQPTSPNFPAGNDYDREAPSILYGVPSNKASIV